MPLLSGVKFDDAWKRRLEIVVDGQTGLKAFVISVDDFITNKLALGRHQDLADVESRQSRTALAPGARKVQASREEERRAPGVKYGYTRVSTEDQNAAIQRAALEEEVLGACLRYLREFKNVFFQPWPPGSYALFGPSVIQVVLGFRANAS